MGPLWRDQSGQNMVEFALIFVPLVFIIAGLFDLTRAIYTYDSLAEAARAGARYAMVRGENAATADRVGACPDGSDSDSADDLTCDCNTTATTRNLDKVRAAVLTRTILMDVNTLTITCSWPDTVSAAYSNARGKRVSVSVSYPFVPILADFIGVGAGAAITMTSTAAVIIDY